MPMLTTLRMRFPVCPSTRRCGRDRQKAAILSSTAWTSGTTFSPSTTMDALARCAQRHVKDGAVFGDVDFFAAEHGVDPVPQSGFLRQLEQKLQWFRR